MAVRDIIARAFDRATEILRTRHADLDRGVQLLLTQETLTVEDFPAISPAAAAEKKPAVLPHVEAAPIDHLGS